jgi:hypothetical protein
MRKSYPSQSDLFVKPSRSIDLVGPDREKALLLLRLLLMEALISPTIAPSTSSEKEAGYE